MDNTELIVKHLEMIQGVINRMARNSFMLKGWSVTIVSALLALNASNTNIEFVYIAYLPALIFWVLDAYFLSQERYFRRLYDNVRTRIGSSDSGESINHFSMATSSAAKPGDNLFAVMFSLTLFLFHGAIIAFITLAVFFFPQ